MDSAGAPSRVDVQRGEPGRRLLVLGRARRPGRGRARAASGPAAAPPSCASCGRLSRPWRAARAPRAAAGLRGRLGTVATGLLADRARLARDQVHPQRRGPVGGLRGLDAGLRRRVPPRSPCSTVACAAASVAAAASRAPWSPSATAAASSATRAREAGALGVGVDAAGCSAVRSPAAASSARTFSSRSSAACTSAWAARGRVAGGGHLVAEARQRRRRPHRRERRELPLHAAQLGRRRCSPAARASASAGSSASTAATSSRGGRDGPLGRGERGVVGVGQVAEQAAGRRDPGLGLPLPDAGPLADLLVDVQAEQVDQDLLPLGRLGVQEPGELALRQHDAAGELLVRQADRVEHGGVHLGRGAGEHGAEAGSPRSAGAVSKRRRSKPGGSCSSPAWAVETLPLPSRRTTRVATNRAPDASKTSRTRASAADGASAFSIRRRSPQRGTVP